MTTSRLLSSLALVSVLAAPASAFAHEHQSFRINGKTYEFTIGSINEPVAVDDKSGVEFSVGLATEHAEDPAHVDGDEHEAATPVTGLEKTLKIELQAADKKKELPVTTVYGEVGSYKAVFIPTVATTLTYRIFGTIDGTPEDTTELKIDDDVTRTLKRGSFGCPAAKADLGFPEPAATLVELSDDEDDGSSTHGVIALALSAAALAFAAMAFSRASRPKA